MWLFLCEWNTDDDGWKNLLDPWKVVPSTRSLGYFRLQRSSRLKTSVISKRERRQLKNAKLLIYFSTCNLFTHLSSYASLIAEMISLLPNLFNCGSCVTHTTVSQVRVPGIRGFMWLTKSISVFLYTGFSVTLYVYRWVQCSNAFQEEIVWSCALLSQFFQSYFASMVAVFLPAFSLLETTIQTFAFWLVVFEHNEVVRLRLFTEWECECQEGSSPPLGQMRPFTTKDGMFVCLCGFIFTSVVV